MHTRLHQRCVARGYVCVCVGGGDLSIFHTAVPRYHTAVPRPLFCVSERERQKGRERGKKERKKKRLKRAIIAVFAEYCIQYSTLHDYDIVSYQFILNHIMSCHATLYHAILIHVIVMSCHVISRHVMSCQVISRHAI